MNEPVAIHRREVAQRILMANRQGGWEGTHTDFKTELGSTSRDLAKLFKHILAFANTPRRTDAYLIFGVKEDKASGRFDHIGVAVDGFPQAERIYELLHHYTRLRDIFIDAAYEVDGKRTPYICIPLQDEGPQTVLHPFPGGIDVQEVFWRRGSSSARATDRDILRMRSDWERWCLDCRYEKTATSLINTLSKRFPNHKVLLDLGPCVRLIYDSAINDELGMHVAPVLVHAYWGFEPVEPAAIERLNQDKVQPTFQKTIIGARFSLNTLALAQSSSVRCVYLDEIYFVDDPYAKLCREFLRQLDIDQSSQDLSSIIDLDYRASGSGFTPEVRKSILSFLEDQLNGIGRSAVLVHGDFGCGKTTTAKQLVAELCEEYLRGNFEVPKVLYLDVSNMDIRSRRDECIEGQLNRLRLSREDVAHLVASVQQDQISVVFDGVDEMARPYTEAGRHDTIEVLRGIANRRVALYFVRTSYFPKRDEMIAQFALLADLDFSKSQKRIVVTEILHLRQEQVTEYLKARLGPEGATSIQGSLHKFRLESFLKDPLIVSLVAKLVEKEGIESLESLPRKEGKAHFLSSLIEQLVGREQKKRSRHSALFHDFLLFRRVLRTVAFNMTCRGNSSILQNQLKGFVERALDSEQDATEAVNEFRTMAWIHCSPDGTLRFRHEALTLVCAADHVCEAFELRDNLAIGDWQPTAPHAPEVCQYAGEVIEAPALLGATAMLSTELQFNVHQLVTKVLDASKDRRDIGAVPEDQLDERGLASICRGIATAPLSTLQAVKILLNSLGEKRARQITLALLWLLLRKDTTETSDAVLTLVRPIVRKDWNFCDELREIKKDPANFLDLMLLKDLHISIADFLDSLNYEMLFKKIYEIGDLETPTRQYADRTLRGMEGERNRRQASHSKQAQRRR
ncbi:MAG: NACHT domain-containing protein [Acidobacteriia bacterium]|nr:NACHT domain-containing protein [Terriglobia bacterium]